MFNNAIKKKLNRDEHPQYIFILLSGTIHICNDFYVANTTIPVVEEYGDCFGEVYLFLENNYPFYAKAIKDSIVLLIPKELFNTSLVLSNHSNTILAKKALALSEKLVLMMENTLRDQLIMY